MDKLYKATPDGYCGDEDNGQTSAWYLFSALGFYPVCPGTDEYVVGSPLFRKAVISLENGKKVVISSGNNKKEHRYIQSLKIDGKEYDKNYLKHEMFLKGMDMQFEMSEKPNKQRGVSVQAAPYSFSK
jgi:putative alpha-1,2-mannosidase